MKPANKKTIWTWIYSVIIVFMGVVAGSGRCEPFFGFCVVLGLACVFLALAQLGVWAFYDIFTLKRGGWRIPEFGESVFADSGSPGFFLTKVFLGFGVAGFAALFLSPWRGISSAAAGLVFLICGFVLAWWQKRLIRLFKARFAARPNPINQAVLRPWQHLRIR